MKRWLVTFGPAIAIEGAGRLCRGVRDVGGDALAIFTSLYTGYRIIQPRYPQRGIYALETDRVFFEPEPSRYKGCVLQPERSRDFAGVDLLGDVTKAAKEEGLSVAALIPMFAAGRFAKEYPGCAVLNLFGSRDRLFFCFNNPEVLRYRNTMIEDIASRYEVDAILLDKMPQTMLEQDAFNGRINPLLRVVGSFCFCEHCQQAASERGLDLSAVKDRCTEIAHKSLRIPQHTIEALRDHLAGDTEVPQLLIDEPLIYDMLQFRFDCVTDYIRKVREQLKAIRPDVQLHAAFVPTMHIGHDATSPRSWLAVQSYRRYAEVFDLIHCVVHWSPDVVRYETHRAVDAVAGKCRLCTDLRLYGPTRPEEVSILAEEALAGGADALGFLGYDVASEELLNALRAWAKKPAGDRLG